MEAPSEIEAIYQAIAVIVIVVIALAIGWITGRAENRKKDRKP